MAEKRKNSQAFDDLVKEFCTFAGDNSAADEIVKTCSEASDGVCDFDKDINVIKLDTFVQMYFSPFWKDEMSKKGLGRKIDEFNAVDGVYISEKGEWYFIEFKSAGGKYEDISAKNKILTSIWIIFFVLTENKSPLLPANMIDFCRNNITYIITYKDDCEYTFMINSNELSDKHFTPGKFATFKDLVFKDVYALTGKYLRRNLDRM